MLPRHPRRARQHALTAEAVREVDILLVAFAPLHAVFSDRVGRGLQFGLLFFLAGLLLFMIGLKVEGADDSG